MDPMDATTVRLPVLKEPFEVLQDPPRKQPGKLDRPIPAGPPKR
jgi:hypothetical protein